MKEGKEMGAEIWEEGEWVEETRIHNKKDHFRLSGCNTSCEYTFPVVPMATIWEFSLNILKVTGQWYFPATREQERER